MWHDLQATFENRGEKSGIKQGIGTYWTFPVLLLSNLVQG
jgi:hypothetical protein